MKKLLTALIFTLATAVGAGDFEDGMAASKRGDNKTAFSFFKKAAEQGDSEAQHFVGLFYDLGQLGGSHRTTQKPSVGSSWQLSKGIQRHSTKWAWRMTMALGFYRITQKPSVGSSWQLRKVIH